MLTMRQIIARYAISRGDATFVSHEVMAHIESVRPGRHPNSHAPVMRTMMLAGELHHSGGRRGCWQATPLTRAVAESPERRREIGPEIEVAEDDGPDKPFVHNWVRTGEWDGQLPPRLTVFDYGSAGV